MLFSRRMLLGVSVAISLALHVLLYVIAPSIEILTGEGRAKQVIRAYRVQLAELPRIQLDPERTETFTAGLTTRPESVEDLLKRETAELQPMEELMTERVEVPMLRERVAAEMLERPRENAPEDMVLAKIDAKIIEISQNAARSEINVARRFVAPSPERVLSDGEFPTLRELGADTLEERLDFVPHVMNPSADITAASPIEALPPREDVMAPVRPGQDSGDPMPDLTAETLAARSPVFQAIERDQRFEELDAFVDLKLDTYVPPGGDTGYFRLRIVPKEGQELTPLPKDVTFIIDASSSILQRKLVESARAVQDAVANLRASDLFNVVLFRETPILFQPDRVPATEENKQAAMAFLNGLESKGQTNVYEAIRPEVLRAPRPGLPGIVVLVTDGKPTQGLKDGQDIINALTDENNMRNSIYAVAAGRSVNRYLLDLLAYRNKGEAHIIDDVGAIGRDFPEFFSRLEDPLLVDCHVNYGRINETTVFPKEVPDFYRGQVVTVFGQFDPTQDRDFAVRLTGKSGPEEKEVIFRADLREAESTDESIVRLWAHRKIYYLIGEICRLGELPELKSELQALSTKYNIGTIYTN